MDWDHRQQRPMETDRATTSRRWDPPKTQEDWTRPPRANDLYHTPSPDQETTGTEKAWLPEKHVEPRSGGWNNDGWPLGTTWEACPGSGCLESSCGRPVLQQEPKALTTTMMMMMTTSGAFRVEPTANTSRHSSPPTPTPSHLPSHPPFPPIHMSSIWVYVISQVCPSVRLSSVTKKS